MQKLPIEKIKQVLSLYPGISTEALYEKEDLYSKKFISAFDHWLTEEECELHITPEVHHRHFNKLLSFYKALFDRYICYQYIKEEWEKDLLLEFSSKDDYIKQVYKSLNEEEFIKIVVPELRLIIDGGYDYTLPLFSVKEESIRSLQPLLENENLYLLD